MTASPVRLQPSLLRYGEGTEITHKAAQLVSSKFSNLYSRPAGRAQTASYTSHLLQSTDSASLVLSNCADV